MRFIQAKHSGENHWEVISPFALGIFLVSNEQHRMSVDEAMALIKAMAEEMEFDIDEAKLRKDLERSA